MPDCRPAIRALARGLAHARLALSLGSARPGRRCFAEPIDQAHPRKVLDRRRRARLDDGLSPLFAYTLLGGKRLRGRPRALAALLLDFGRTVWTASRLSLIAYNAIGGDDPYVRTAPDAEERFVRRSSRMASSDAALSGGSDVAPRADSWRRRVEWRAPHQPELAVSPSFVARKTSERGEERTPISVRFAKRVSLAGC